METANSLRYKNEFINNSILRIDESILRVKKCISILNDDEIWARPNENLNSIGNLILHLSGNINQYILYGLGNTEIIRKRQLEFDHSQRKVKDELINEWLIVIEKAKEIINTSSDEQLLKQYSIQGFNLSGIGIITHVVEHLSYHVGQIAVLTKLYKNKELGFYDGFDLNLQ